MTKMQKIVLLMTYWFQPGGDIKAMMWEDFTNGKPFTEDNLFLVFALIINGVDENYLNWNVFDGFIDEMNKANGLVVAEVATPEGQVEEALSPVAAKPKRKPRTPKKETKA